MDPMLFAGLGLGLLAIFGTQYIEGGRVASLLQGGAALVVFGGTCGACLVSYAARDVRRALGMLLELVFGTGKDERPALLARLVEMSLLARREGLLALERSMAAEPNPFLRKALGYLVDGLEPEAVRAILEREMDEREQRAETAVQVFESAGGFAPTFGILGAVLGLIHTMERLNDPSKLGEGIAVAFVATVYGVGSANLIFLPLANKLRLRIRALARADEMVLEGVLGILAGLNHHLLRERLAVYLLDTAPGQAAGRRQPGREVVGEAREAA